MPWARFRRPRARAPSFVFGYLGGGTLPFDLKAPGADFILAFQALPIVLVMSVADHTSVLLAHPAPSPCAAWRGSWSARLASAARSGCRPPPIFFWAWWKHHCSIRPYLAQLTRSELFLVMTGGMAGIAGTVLVLYATLLAPLIPDAAAHFVIASVLGAPAAILVSLIMVPEADGRHTGGTLEVPAVAAGGPRVAPDPGLDASSTMDAIVQRHDGRT